ncbi:MAG: hypothetical protein HFG48_01250 [Bacilli bacterium]|nr:hypothetical protein [Bacilli bacterium]
MKKCYISGAVLMAAAGTGFLTWMMVKKYNPELYYDLKHSMRKMSNDIENSMEDMM